MAPINTDESEEKGDRQSPLHELAKDLSGSNTGAKSSLSLQTRPSLFASFATTQNATAASDPTAPLPAPAMKIPRRSRDNDATEKRLEKLETLMTSQADSNEKFRGNIMSILMSMSQGQSGYDEYDGQEEDYADEADADVDEAERQGEAFESPEVTEVGKSMLTEEMPVSGFAVKFASSSYGDEIDGETASSLQYLLTNKLAEKHLTDLLEKYETPKNAKNLCVPKVNQQIWDSLRPHTRNNDLKLQKVEKLMVKGITAIAKNKEGLSEDQENGLTCLAAAVFEMNMLRREFIKPGLQEKFAPLCKTSIPITENLFGNDLSKYIKDIDEVNKVTTQMARFAPYNT